jgi:hypothetical protein
MGERKEIFMRIIVAIITGIILGFWGYFIFDLGVVNWFYVLFKGKRMKSLAEMSEMWNTQQYIFYKYLTFMSNERPFPFRGVSPNISKFGK